LHHSFVTIRKTKGLDDRVPNGTFRRFGIDNLTAGSFSVLVTPTEWIPASPAHQKALEVTAQ